MYLTWKVMVEEINSKKQIISTWLALNLNMWVLYSYCDMHGFRCDHFNIKSCTIYLAVLFIVSLEQAIKRSEGFLLFWIKDTGLHAVRKLKKTRGRAGEKTMGSIVIQHHRADFIRPFLTSVKNINPIIMILMLTLTMWTKFGFHFPETY